jgi:hypothetical protein
MKLRRLLLLPSEPELGNGPSILEAGSSGPGEESSWDLVAELDRLRSANTGLTAEVDRQTQIGQDYARVASEQRVRVEELERENAIAHANCQMLERRLAQAEERALEFEELVEALRAQRDRLQTYHEQQEERARKAEATCAALRDAAGTVLSASDLQSHAAVGTRGFARARIEFEDGVAKLRRALERDAGRDFLAPEVVEDVRRFFDSGTTAPDEKKQLRQSIVRALGVSS